MCVFFTQFIACILLFLWVAVKRGGCFFGFRTLKKKMCFFFSRAHATFNPTEWKKAHTKTNNKSAQKSEPFLLSLRLFSEEIWQKCIRGSGASCLSAWHSAHANLMRICFIFICCRLFCRFFFSDSLSLSLSLIPCHLKRFYYNVIYLHRCLLLPHLIL